MRNASDIIGGILNWHAHGESNPGYRRERAMSDPLVRSQILYPTELRVQHNHLFK